MTGTANHSFEYALDGSGVFSVPDAQRTNLSAETISPTVGFKMRPRVTVTTEPRRTFITYVRITMDLRQLRRSPPYPRTSTRSNGPGLKNPSEFEMFDSRVPQRDRRQENVTSGTFTTQIDPGTYRWKRCDPPLGYQTRVS